MAQDHAVDTVAVRGLWWREIDSREDLEDVRKSHARQKGATSPRAASASARS